MLCQSLVQGLDEWWDEAERDVVIVDVVVQNENGDGASVEDAARWQDDRGISDWVVLAAGDTDWVDIWGNPDSDTYVQHSYTVIGRDGRVAWHATGYTGTRHEDIIEALADVP